MQEAFEGIKPSRQRERQGKHADGDNVIPISEGRYRRTRVESSVHEEVQSGVLQGEEHIELTAKRPNRRSGDFVRGIQGSVPEGFNFDREWIPPETVHALESAGLSVRPFEKDGEHFLEVTSNEGGKNTVQVLRHSEAVTWLQNVVSAYDEDAKNLTRVEKKIDRTQKDIDREYREATLKEMERIDRETLVATLSDWFDDVQILEGTDIITMKRKEDGLLLEVPLDHINDFIAKRDDLNEEMLAISKMRDESASQKEKKKETPQENASSDSAEKHGPELPTLTDSVDGVVIPEIVLKALRQEYDSVTLSPDGKAVVLSKGKEKPFRVMLKDATRLISLRAEVKKMRKKEAQDEIPAPTPEQDPVSPQDAQENTVAEEKVSMDSATVRDALLAAEKRNRRSLAQLKKQIRGRLKGQQNEEEEDDTGEPEILRTNADRTDADFNPAESAPKRKFSPEEQRAYLESLKNKKKEVTDSEQRQAEENPIQNVAEKAPSKPHLNNAESIQYLKDVQETRRRERTFIDGKTGRTVITEPPHKNFRWKKGYVLRAATPEELSIPDDTKEGAIIGGDGFEWVPEGEVDLGDTPSPKSEQINSEGNTQGNAVGEQEIPTVEEVSAKPHLNNAESIAYLKEVALRREREAAAQKEMLPETENSGEAKPTEEVPGKESASAESGPEQAAEVVGEGQPSQRRRTSRMEQMRNGARNAEDATVTSEQKIDLEAAKKDIAFLERVKSEISYGSKEFEAFIKNQDPAFAKEWKALGGSRDAATIMWIERKLASLKSDAKEATVAAENFFDDRFEKDFGISKAELMELPGFEKLSNGQQMLVYENLRDYALAESRGEASQMWATAKEMMGVVADTKPKEGAYGIEAYKDFLMKLVYSTAEHGPRVHVENGKLMADFIGMSYDREHRAEQKAACDLLNSAAHAFTKIPSSWQEDGNGVHAKNESKLTTFLKEKVFRTESRMHYLAFKEAEKAYEDAKRTFARELEKTGVPREQVVQSLIEVDGKVFMTRFIDSDPEIAKLLEGIPDKDLWQKVTSIGKAGLFYAGLGGIGRALTASALGILSGPAVAASIAGTRAWNRTAAEQRERDRQARMGTDDESAGALNIVPASETIQTREGELDMGLTAKLDRLITKYEGLSEDTDPKDRMKLIGQIRARVLYTEDKLRLNRIQFGDEDSFAFNQVHLMETLGCAKVLLANEEGYPKTALEERLKRYLTYREGAINDRRHKEQRKKVAQASTIAAGMALGGAYAMNEFLESDMGQRATEKIKAWTGWGSVGNDQPATNESSSVPSGDVSLRRGFPGGIDEAAEGNNMDSSELREPEGAEKEVVTETGESPTEPQGEKIDPALNERATALEERYLSERVPQKTWNMVKGLHAERVIQEYGMLMGVKDPKQLAELLAGRERQYPGMNEVHKILFEAGKPPFNLKPVPSEPVETFLHRIFVENARLGTTEGIPSDSVELAPQEGFQNQKYGEADTIPSSPTPEERAEIQRLFENDQKNMPYGGEAVRLNKEVISRGLDIESYFLRTHVHERDWRRVQGTTALSFIDKSFAPDAKNRLPQALSNLGKVFNEVGQRFGVEPFRGETTASFTRRAFLTIAEAESRGENIDNIRGYLTNIKKDWFPRR